MPISAALAAVAVTDLSGRGIDTGEVIDGVISRVTQVRDPAGNTITLAELSD